MVFALLAGMIPVSAKLSVHLPRMETAMPLFITE